MENQQTEIKKPVWKKWWFWVIIVFVIIVIASMGGEKTTPTKKEVEQKTQSTPTPTLVKEWVRVIGLTANANKQSGTFQLKGGQQKVVYSVSSTSDYSSGMCYIYVMEEETDLMKEGGFPIVMADGGMSDETMMRKNGGNYYLDLAVIHATCVVEIYEYR